MTSTQPSIDFQSCSFVPPKGIELASGRLVEIIDRYALEDGTALPIYKPYEEIGPIDRSMHIVHSTVPYLWRRAKETFEALEMTETDRTTVKDISKRLDIRLDTQYLQWNNERIEDVWTAISADISTLHDITHRSQKESNPKSTKYHIDQHALLEGISWKLTDTIEQPSNQ